MTLSIIGNSQISTREINYNPTVKPMIYDSLYYFYTYAEVQSFSNNSQKLKQFIGQDITILPISRHKYNKEYEGFYLFSDTLRIEELYSLIYDYSARKNFNDILITSNLQNNVYKIIAAEQYEYSSEYWHLIIANNIDTLYYIPTSFCIPFVVNGFLEKHQEMYVNMSFVPKKELKTRDINTGEDITIKTGTKWKCSEITFIDYSYITSSVEWQTDNTNDYLIPVLVFNDNKNEILVSFVLSEFGRNRFDNNNLLLSLDNFYTQEEYEEINLTYQQKEQKLEEEEQKKQAILKENISKYGESYGTLINQSKVVIGMSKEMCIAAWGHPILIEKVTLEGVEYVSYKYDYKTFLYFINNELKIIKE